MECRFSREEARLLVDIVDWWEDGVQEAKETSQQDRTLALEELLEAAAGFDYQVEVMKKVRSSLLGGGEYDRGESTTGTL